MEFMKSELVNSFLRIWGVSSSLYLECNEFDRFGFGSIEGGIRGYGERWWKFSYIVFC